MRSVLFRCPTTGLQVNVVVADEPTDDDTAFMTIVCTACSGSHFVNAKTGKVLGSPPREDGDA